MHRTSRPLLVVIALLVGLIAALVLRGMDGRGQLPPPVPTVTVLVPLAFAVVLLLRGRAVRRLVARERTSMTAVGAARVVLLAKACALVGSALAGYFAAHVLVSLGNLSAPLPREHAWSSGVAVLGSVVLVIVALVVERWCEVPPPEDDEKKGARGTDAAAA